MEILGAILMSVAIVIVIVGAARPVLSSYIISGPVVLKGFSLMLVVFLLFDASKKSANLFFLEPSHVSDT